MEYSLTELGLTLGPILRMMREWGVRHMGHVEQAIRDDREAKTQPTGGQE